MLTFRFKFSVVFFLILFFSKVNAQNRISLDTINNAVYVGEFKLQSTESFISKYKYDSKLNLYLLENKLGNIVSGLPLKLTPKEYREIFRKSLINNYFKEQISILEDENKYVNKRSLLPDLYVNSSFFESKLDALEYFYAYELPKTTGLAEVMLHPSSVTIKTDKKIIS